MDGFVLSAIDGISIHLQVKFITCVVGILLMLQKVFVVDDFANAFIALNAAIGFE